MRGYEHGFTRAATGRFHWWWNIVITAGFASPVALPKAWRLVGIIAIAAQLVVIATPLLSDQIRVG